MINLQYKFYNTRDVELLKEKVKQYEDALQTVQLKKPAEQLQSTFLFDKYIEQMKILERIIQTMKENREGQMETFIQHVHHISNELQSIKGLIKELREEISEVKINMNHLNEHIKEELPNETMKGHTELDQELSHEKANLQVNETSNEADYEFDETPSNFRDLRNLLAKSNNLTLSPLMDQRSSQITNFHGRTTIVRNNKRNDRNIRNVTHHSRKTNLKAENKQVTEPTQENQQKNEQAIEQVNQENKNTSNTLNQSRASRKKNEDSRLSQFFRRN